MDFVISQTYLGDILHYASQALLAPDIILLIAFMLYALFSIGRVVVEAITERRTFQVCGFMGELPHYSDRWP